MGEFEIVSVPGERLDPQTITAVAAIFASYVDSDRAAPLHEAVNDLVDEPLYPEQLLNCVVALGNVDALLALTLGEDEQAASELVSGVLARAANDSTDGVFPEGIDDDLHGEAQAMINRVFGTAELEAMPEHLTGRLLVALAAYGDAAVVLADRLGIPRSVLGPALVQAAEQM